MSRLQLNPPALIIAAIMVGVIIVFIEIVFMGASDGTLLLTLSFWTALIQGTVAVPAAVDITKTTWISPIKKDLLAFYPLILLTAFMFLFLGFQIDMYPWAQKEGVWLNKTFFLIRNFVLLVVSFIFAHLYAKAALRGSRKRVNYAVFYILLFVITQSMVAFDWIMPLEYPWFSTLFGGLFFVESFYTGLAIACLICAYLIVNNIQNAATVKPVMRDSATFMFGFALFWAGLFYAQFLVIWYGNLPEETSFMVRRMHLSPYQEMFYLNIMLLFIIPFVALIPRNPKFSYKYVSVISGIVIIGVLMQRLIYLLPDVHVGVLAAIIDFLLMGFLMVLFFVNRERFLGAGATS